LLVSGRAGESAARDAEIDATFSAQSYVVRSPYGSPTVRSRRFTQTLGLGVYDIHDTGSQDGPQLSLVTRLRLDADLGQRSVERDIEEQDSYIPGLERMPLELMAAYVDAQGYADGWLGARAGRQYLVDALGWWSFDGALLTVSTPAYVRLEAYGGYEHRAGLNLLSTSRFSGDGVSRGNRDGLEADEWTSYLESSRLAPAYGLSLETLDLDFLHARVGYRKVINRDRVSITHFADADGQIATLDDERVSSERIGGSATLTAADWGALAGRAVYDFLSQVASEHGATVTWYATRQISLGLEYDYFLPTFDGDSIFNWFTHRAMTTYQGRGYWQLTRRVALSASTGLRQFFTDGTPDEYRDQSVAFGVEPQARQTTGVATDVLGSGTVDYRLPTGTVSLTATGEAGGSGHHLGGDLTTTRTFAGGVYDTLLILSLHDWRDELRAGRDATSFAYVLGGGLSPLPGSRLGVEWEHAINRLVGNRFRVLGTLTLAVLQ